MKELLKKQVVGKVRVVHIFVALVVLVIFLTWRHKKAAAATADDGSSTDVSGIPPSGGAPPSFNPPQFQPPGLPVPPGNDFPTPQPLPIEYPPGDDPGGSTLNISNPDYQRVKQLVAVGNQRYKDLELQINAAKKAGASKSVLIAMENRAAQAKKDVAKNVARLGSIPSVITVPAVSIADQAIAAIAGGASSSGAVKPRGLIAAANMNPIRVSTLDFGIRQPIISKPVVNTSTGVSHVPVIPKPVVHPIPAKYKIGSSGR